MEPTSGNTPNLPMPEPTPPAAPPVALPVAPAAPIPAGVPASAQDSDRIEHEWIIKIRQIQLTMRNDPYEQARQLAALRADYMAKRYNKIIKIGE